MNQNYQYTNGILPGFLRIAIANDTICTWSGYIPITYANPNNTLPVVKTGWVQAGSTSSPITGPIWSHNTGDSGNKTEYIVTNPYWDTQTFGKICFKSTSGYSISFTIYIKDNDAYKNRLITGVLFVWANEEKLQYWYDEGVEYNGTTVNYYNNNDSGNYSTMGSISASCYFNQNNYTNVNNLNPNWMQIIPITAGGSAIMNVTSANYYPQSFLLSSGCN
jgi:hypothetical protein